MKTSVDLTKDNIFKSLLLFAIPLFVSNLFQQMYNTVDTMIIGHYLGDTSLAAIGACTPIYDLLIGFALGVAGGMGIITARAFGAQDEKELKKSVALSLNIGVVITAATMILSVLILKPLLNILHTPEEIINESYEYISTITLYVGVLFAYNLFAGVLRAIGNSLMPLVFLIISSVLNIFLDIFFISNLNMGIKGAAVATVIASGISAVLCLIYIFKKCHIVIPTKECFKTDKAMYKDLIGQGLSMGLMLSIVSMGTVILQYAINGLGYLIIAGHTAARRLSGFCTMPIATFSAALATFVSQNKGAGKYDRIKKGVSISNWICVIWSVFISVVLFFTARSLVGALSGSAEEEVLKNGSMYLIINAPFFTVLGILLNLRNSLQGLGEKVVPLVSSIIELVGKCVFVAVFIPMFNYMGVIICEPVIWCAMTLQLCFAFYKNPYIKGADAKPELNTVSE